jgi:hypothetical protein
MTPVQWAYLAAPDLAAGAAAFYLGLLPVDDGVLLPDPCRAGL